MTKRQKAILKRNLFLTLCVVVIIAVIALVVFVAGSVSKDKPEESSQNQSSEIESKKEENEQETPSKPEKEEVMLGNFKADANYKRLLLVNTENPLAEDYDYTENLMTFPESYKKGSKEYLQIDKDMWPYLKAMMDDARKDGIDIGIISPFRDYNTQKHLFDSKVQTYVKNGLSKAEAEKKTATQIAIPGTSEHHTGLAVDFNSTNESFENTEAFKWLKINAENYGFIMRYAKDKMDITGGIIYEPWHWRFVGINTAKEMNKLQMCLEEYVEYNS